MQSMVLFMFLRYGLDYVKENKSIFEISGNVQEDFLSEMLRVVDAVIGDIDKILNPLAESVLQA